MSPKQPQHDGLWAALKTETPLQVVGVINAYSALLAKQAGLSAIYLSGSGVAAASYGLPDLALTTLANVLEDVRRISHFSRSHQSMLPDKDDHPVSAALASEGDVTMRLFWPF